MDVSNSPLSAAQRSVGWLVDTSLFLCLRVCRSLKVEKPDVVVGTPSKLLAQLQNKVSKPTVFCVSLGGVIPCVYPRLPPPPSQNLSLKESMETLVVDEADLLFSYGYEDDIKTLLRCVCVQWIVVHLQQRIAKQQNHNLD